MDRLVKKDGKYYVCQQLNMGATWFRCGKCGRGKVNPNYSERKKCRICGAEILAKAELYRKNKKNLVKPF